MVALWNWRSASGATASFTQRAMLSAIGQPISDAGTTEMPFGSAETRTGLSIPQLFSFTGGRLSKRTPIPVRRWRQSALASLPVSAFWSGGGSFRGAPSTLSPDCGSTG